MTLASVKLPTQPSGEITVSGGVRPTLGPLEFDMGATYFAYPGETPGGPTNGIEYWEATFRGAAPFGESIRVAAGYAYSPNISNTGAWSQYVAAGFGYEVQLVCFRRKSASRSPPPPDTRGSATSHLRSADSNCLPISTGRRA